MTDAQNLPLAIMQAAIKAVKSVVQVITMAGSESAARHRIKSVSKGPKSVGTTLKHPTFD